jgi:hypothetical protein
VAVTVSPVPVFLRGKLKYDKFCSGSTNVQRNLNFSARVPHELLQPGP